MRLREVCIARLSAPDTGKTARSLFPHLYRAPLREEVLVTQEAGARSSSGRAPPSSRVLPRSSHGGRGSSAARCRAALRCLAARICFLCLRPHGLTPLLHV
jgi:hypothetical protein